MDSLLDPFLAFFLNCGQWVNLTWFPGFFFSETMNSRRTASLLSNHKSHSQLVSSLNSCASQAETHERQTIVQMDK